MLAVPLIAVNKGEQAGGMIPKILTYLKEFISVSQESLYTGNLQTLILSSWQFNRVSAYPIQIQGA